MDPCVCLGCLEMSPDVIFLCSASSHLIQHWSWREQCHQSSRGLLKNHFCFHVFPSFSRSPAPAVWQETMAHFSAASHLQSHTPCRIYVTILPWPRSYTGCLRQWSSRPLLASGPGANALSSRHRGPGHAATPGVASAWIWEMILVRFGGPMPPARRAAPSFAASCAAAMALMSCLWPAAFCGYWLAPLLGQLAPVHLPQLPAPALGRHRASAKLPRRQLRSLWSPLVGDVVPHAAKSQPHSVVLRRQRLRWLQRRPICPPHLRCPLLPQLRRLRPLLRSCTLITRSALMFTMRAAMSYLWHNVHLCLTAI